LAAAWSGGWPATAFLWSAWFGSNHAEAHAAVAEAEGTGAKATTVAADVGDEQAVTRLFDRAEEHFGGVDAVGLMSLPPLADFDLAALARMLRTNVRGTFVIDQQATCRVRLGGTIINFSSSTLGQVLPTYTGYAASKAAVEATTFSLAHELRSRDVTVNAVAPGPTAIDMLLEGKDQELLDRLANAAPLDRLGVPDDIAPVVAFLASPEGHWINGQTVRVKWRNHLK
jgi:3-oxoacyl-[acyl-carrier protein] reductase